MRTLLQDVRFGMRVLRNSPGFTAVAIITLAVGMAANTTVFSWVDGLLLHPFTGSTDTGRLAVMEMLTQAPNGGTQLSWLDYRDLRKTMTTISGLAVQRDEVFVLGEAKSMQPVWGELVSGNYFAVLGVRPELGRVFTREEDGDKQGAYPVMVISHSLWQGRFRGDPAVIGRTVRVNQHQLTVVGVAPPEFHGTIPGLVFDMWVPATMAPHLGMAEESMFRRRSYRNLYGLVRLKAGVAREQAAAEAMSVARNLAAAFPATNRGLGTTIVPVWRFHSGAPDLLLGPLRILMAVAVIVLLIVCSNVANLLLARSVGRQKEFAIRVALGATRMRLGRQMLIEALLLAVPAALLALLATFWIAGSLHAMVPRVGFNSSSGFHLNGRILGFTFLICAMSALISAVAPALFSARSDVNETLKEGGRGGSARAQSHRTRGLLVIAEIALAAVALIGAGLFSRSFRNARAIDPGFDRNNVLLGRFYLANAAWAPPDMKRFSARLREGLQSAPGVTAVAYADFAPLGSTAGPWQEIEVEGYVPAAGEFMNLNRSQVGPGYFDVLRIPLLAGRSFIDSDDVKAPPVAIVNEAFAQRYFHGANPIGRRIKCWSAWHRIIGLARDSKYFSVAEAPRPFFYVPFRQRFGRGGQMYLLIRTQGEPMGAAAALRREVAAIDPGAGTFFPVPLTDWTEITMLPQKMAATILSVMATIALLLAGVGLYSVMAYSMSQRTQEMGIRMALGAMPRDVIRLVLQQGLALTITGLGVGIAAALIATRVIAGMLVNVSGADPLTFAGVALFLAAVAALACFLPAFRATRVDPVTALHCE